MGRTRTTNTRTRHLKATSSQATSSVATPPSVPDLLAKAQSLIEQCNYQLAARFLQRILETDATHIEARELLGVVQLELGDLDAARLVGPPPPHKKYRPLAEDKRWDFSFFRRSKRWYNHHHTRLALVFPQPTCISHKFVKMTPSCR